MLDVKSAVGQAKNHLGNLQDELGEIRNIRLEETILTDDERYWMITLGYDRLEIPNDNSPLETALLPRRKREYKQFKIDTEMGKVIAMTVRNP